MRMGVFGGTFDPVHLGHLILAEQCREQGRLDQVRFVPAARPPHKDRPLTPFDRRVEMLELAVSGHPAFWVDPLESERDGPSYTVDTLHILGQRHPGAELFLIIGSDTLNDLPTWYQTPRILELAALLVVARPGSPMRTEDELRASLGLPGSAPVRMHAVQAPLIEIASRDVRRRFAEDRSVRYLIPRAVEAYARDKGLYGAGKENEPPAPRGAGGS